MNEHDVFVTAECPAAVVRAVIEAALGAAFSTGQGLEPVPALPVGTTMVFFHDSHSFADDVDFAVSRYTYWVNVRDSARNAERQLVIARRVFDAVKGEGWWRCSRSLPRATLPYTHERARQLGPARPPGLALAGVITRETLGCHMAVPSSFAGAGCVVLAV